MPRLLDHLTDRFKKTDAIDHALRYNAVFYNPVRKMLRELDSMDHGARLTLSDYLTQRTLDWMAHLSDGVPAGVPLRERPLVEKSEVRCTCFVAINCLLDPVLAAEFTGPVIVILGGDTIEVLHNHHPERIRLSGIRLPREGAGLLSSNKAGYDGASYIFSWRQRSPT